MSSGDELSLDMLDQPAEPANVQELDQQHLAKVNEAKTSNRACADDSYYTFDTWWWNVILFIFIVGFLTYVSIMIIRGFRRRREYQRVGYRR